MKKSLSLVLSFVLIFGIMPMAYAVEAPKFVVEPQFHHAGDFNEGLAWVATKNGDYVVINRKGDFVVTPGNFKFT